MLRTNGEVNNLEDTIILHMPWKTTNRKAQKPHICEWCPLPIAIGDRYYELVGFYPWDCFQRYRRMHIECLENEKLTVNWLDIRPLWVAGGENEHR